MLEHKKIQNLSDFLQSWGSQGEKGVYFYRINGYSEEIRKFPYMTIVMLQSEVWSDHRG